METGGNFKITINGKQYFTLEEVPEPLRSSIRAKMSSAKTGDAPGGVITSTVTRTYDLKLPGGSFLFSLLLPLLKPGITRPGAPAVPPAADPGTGPEMKNGVPAPSAIQPASSSWLIWLLTLGGIAVYFLFFRK